MYTNADSLTSKMCELQTLIKERKYDIIAITEIFSKFNNQCGNNSVEWRLSGYNILHPDSVESTGRGCLIYAKDNINAYLIAASTELTRFSFNLA